ncbi:MAG: hypothetical protein QW228_08270 [Candidatus Aenigmatarchaeota archaeon]
MELSKEGIEKLVEYLLGKMGKHKPKIYSTLIKLFLAFFIPLVIFFPTQVRAIILPYLILTILCVVAIILLIVFASPMASTFLGDFILALIVLVALFLSTQYINCGEQSCYWILTTRFGTTIALIIVVSILLIFLLVAIFCKGPSYWVLTILLTTLLLIGIPFLSPKNYYSLCKKIPFIYGTDICKPREVFVEPIKTVRIPVSGGIGAKIETPSTLYGGNPYEFTFTITNFYERNISFEVKPSIESSYGSGIEFFIPFTQKVFTLVPRASYQDMVFVDPQQIYVKSGTCPYSTIQLAKAKNIEEEDVVCSASKPCSDPKFACVKLDVLECGCADWVKATCSRNYVNAKIYITHSGFFLGNTTLYYSEAITKPSPAFELTQGPLKVIVEFIPNPYIATIHQYREDVSVFITLKNLGGEIRINKINIIPIETTIHTIDKEKQLELIEKVTSNVKEIRDLSEFLPGVLESGMEIGGKIATLTPPFVETKLIDLETQEVKEINNITFSFIKNYCEKTSVNASENVSAFWSTNWQKIYDAISESGLCELLKKKELNESQIVKNALSHVDVLIELEYERETSFTSGNVIPYTRTEKCLKLVEE